MFGDKIEELDRVKYQLKKLEDEERNFEKIQNLLKNKEIMNDELYNKLNKLCNSHEKLQEDLKQNTSNLIELKTNNATIVKENEFLKSEIEEKCNIIEEFKKNAMFF